MSQPRISGVIPLRNAVQLGYPFDLAIRSMRPLCDEVVVLVDPTSTDDTMEQVRRLSPDVIVESAWDMTNHAGHTNCEISIQTAKACERATGDWVLSLQADEVLHEAETDAIRNSIAVAESTGATGIEMLRLYFYGSLHYLRKDWTQWLLRLFRRGHWKPDVDGAMRFDPVGPNEKRMTTEARIYHYSRVGDAQQIAERVRNLDGFFHPPQRVQSGVLAPYDATVMRDLDTYVVGHRAQMVDGENLLPYDADRHPMAARERYGAER